jgi:hypothetical protein
VQPQGGHHEQIDPTAISSVKDRLQAVYKRYARCPTCVGITCTRLSRLQSPVTYVNHSCTDDGTASDATDANADGHGHNKPNNEKSSVKVIAEARPPVLLSPVALLVAC